MRKDIPENKVTFDYQKIINKYILYLVSHIKENILSIYLNGSFAKGDATDDSDIDIFIILKDIDLNILDTVGKLTHELSYMFHDIKINPQCMGIKEFNSSAYEQWSMKSIIALDSVLLFGVDLSHRKISKSELKITYKKSLADVMMSIRHYICVDKPAEKLTYDKLKIYILKPLMYALRLERYCTTNHYPLTDMELLESFDPKHRILVEYFTNKQLLEDNLKEDHRYTLHNMYLIVDELINQ